MLRDGFVTDEFIALARKDGRSAEEERNLAVLKLEMADRLLAKPATEVYDISQATGAAVAGLDPG